MTLNDERTDAELLTASSAGDQSAFALLVRRYVRRATLLAAQFLDSRDDAEDVTQEAFLVVYRSAGKFDVARPFAPWFFAIVRRLATNRRTREIRRSRLLQLWLWMRRAESGAQSTEAALHASLDAGSASRALESLSPMQRACFELVVVRGLSTEEVATMHDISESTVRQHVFRARAALRDRLRPPDEPKP